MGRKFAGVSRSFSIPIVNSAREIVGWTTTAPEIVGGVLRHHEAERLVGRLECLYVEVAHPEDAVKAGAPIGFRGTWRCLALCDARVLDDESADAKVSSTKFNRAVARIVVQRLSRNDTD